MDTAKLSRELKKGRPAPAYLISGEEDALADRALKIITDKVLGQGGTSTAGADFSLTRLDGKSCSAAEVEAAARTASLFGGHRLVILRDAQALRPEEQKKLAGYLAEPVSIATLVVVVRGAGPNTRAPKLAKAARAARAFKKAVEMGGGKAVDCPRPRTRDLPRMAEQALAEHDLTTDRDGLYALIEAVGEDLGAIYRAAEKLSLYKGGAGRVLAADVAEVVADTRTQSVFDLTDAVAEGSLKKALEGVRRMIRDGESPLSILSHLARHFRNLARVQALSFRGEPTDGIRAELGLHPFVVKKSLQQSRRFRPTDLARCLELLSNTDRQLKGGSLPDGMELELLVKVLCSEGRRQKAEG